MFDLDGVLIDSEPAWQEVRRGLVHERGGVAARSAEACDGYQHSGMGAISARRAWCRPEPEETAATVIKRLQRAFASSPLRDPRTRHRTKS